MKKDFLSLFVHHRVAANLLLALIVLIGIWSLAKLNTQFFPNFALDFVNVRTIWNGASAEDVEKGITKPLEQELFTLNNLHKISSTSATGVSAISLEFKENTDISIALEEINQKLSTFRQMPEEAEKTVVSRIIRYENIAKLAITQSNNIQDIRELSYQIRDELLAKGIAKIDITGLPQEEIRIEVPSRNLIAYNTSLSNIGNQIRLASLDVPAGTIGKENISRQLRALNQQHEIKEFEKLPISINENINNIELGHISSISRQIKNNQIILEHDGKPMVELQLRRTEDSDALVAAKILEDWMLANERRLPQGVNIQIYDQSWQLIEDRISVLLINGLGGLVLVVGILFIFLNGRAAFWVAAGIPISFLATLSIMYAVGSSINMISLFGLIMAVGIIVDDAIVVAEHSQDRFDNGESAASAAENGARRMLAPVASSSLTTIAAFLPLMIVGGVMGKIMFEIPLVIVCVVIASLFECFLILPAHMRFAFSHSKKSVKSGFRKFVDRVFNSFRDNKFLPLVNRAVEYRGITIATAVAMLIFAVALVAGGRIGFTFFPTTESKVINANLSFTAGTPREHVQTFMHKLEASLYETEKQYLFDIKDPTKHTRIIEMVLQRSGVSASGGGTGRRTGEQYGSMFIEIISPDERNFSIPAFVETWKANTQLPPGLELFTISQRQGGPPGQDIDIRLSGATPVILKEASTALQQKLTSYPGLSAIEDDLPWGQEQLIYSLTSTGQELGLTVSDIGQQLRNAFEGQLIQIFQLNNDEIEVKLMLPQTERDNISDLFAFNVYLKNGDFVPLRSVARIKARKGFDALRHSATHLTVRVSADVDRSQNNANLVLQDLKENYLPAMTQEYGIKYTFEGRRAEQSATNRDMKYGSMIALVLIYIILAWVFASYGKPLVVMAAIPFGVTGAIFGHYIMDIELTILSLFGIIGLSGIVVNDSIILVTVYQEFRAKGNSVKQAISQAASSRLRAVILTSLTTIAGLSPLLFETSVQAQFLVPMAVSITFGLAFATLLVLLVIPAILSYQESIYQRLFKAKMENETDSNTPATTTMPILPS